MTNMETPDVPPGVDLSLPSAARVYDWYIGGQHNWAVDREFGQAAMEMFPLIPKLAQHNRGWLRRVVQSALQAGITQFVDLGAGVPTVGAVHEVVANHTDDPAARVVYVDNEPVAAAHSSLILEKQATQDWAGVVQADIRNPEDVLASDVLRRLIDFDRPVCILMVAVLHFVSDDEDIPGILRAYTDRLASGSWLAISHISNDGAPQEQAEQLQRFADSYKNTQNPGYLRTRAEITEWFTGLNLLNPGVTSLQDWETAEAKAEEQDDLRGCSWCGVAALP